nr:immunoglobulin heavy chain junction region [Macaca mulatta]MOW87907.1 immunoglobulin heavy chain junction region [Macaca mulatta]MOW87928.1 immunoglobulin heavy chain junction region [Macaca mulatta]MOW88493.1 immunoglobulin heavy chain junction region [Macaca mulatta]MOW88874.1 immunoglobulin heavy chain junction region [Macaca mulatta]
CARAHSNFDSW